MDENNNAKDGELTAPTFKPEDVAVELRIALTKDGKVFMFFPQDNLATAMALFSKALDMFTGIVGKALGQQEPRRVIPITRAQVPPGVKLR
jgi:hypothetical protein